MLGKIRTATAWLLSAVVAFAPGRDAIAQSRDSFRPIFQSGGVSSSTNKPAVGATTATGQVPAGASASCKRNGSVTGSASVTAQGTVTCTFGSAIVAGDQFSIPWTLAGESPAAIATNAPVVAPANTALPAISGTPQVGQTLASSTGSWSGSPTSYAYAWSAGGTQVQTGASNSYVAQSGDVGKTIAVTVTASNTAGSASATSAATGAVTAAPVGPTLATLATSGLLTNGLASSGLINGATAGSTITSNLAGLTVNSAARTYAWDGTGTAGTAANALTETPTSGAAKSSPAIVLPASTGNLKLSGRQFFGGEPAMFMILAGYASTDTLAVTSDDGTAFTVGSNSQGYPLANGTFPTVPQPTARVLTITGTRSDGSTYVSTMAVLVSPIPAAPSVALAGAKAQKVGGAANYRKALVTPASNQQPTITLNTGNSTVNGRTLAAGGAVATTAVPDGASGVAGQVTQTLAAGAYIYADTTTPAYTYAMGMSKRFVFTGSAGSHFDFKTGTTGAAWGSSYITVLWTDDADSANPTWFASTTKTYVFRAQAAYFDVTFPTAYPGANKRAVEILVGSAQQIIGFNFESGATIAGYDDGKLRANALNDSFDFGQNTLDQAYGVAIKSAMDVFGTRNGYNDGHRTNAWARVGGTTGIHAYVMDRIMSGPYGYDEATNFGRLDIEFGHMSINDATLSNYNAALTSGLKFSNPNNNFVPGTTTLLNMLVTAFRRMRLAQPDSVIVIDVGFYGPDTSYTSSITAADRNAFATVFDNDPLAVLLDFQTGTYRWMGQSFTVPGFTAPLVPSGAVGSSPYFPPGDTTITATISGNVLNVSAIASGGRLEPGMGVGTLGNPQSQRIGAYGTGTGGVGTYILEFAPTTGDVTTPTQFAYTGDTPHPNQAGHSKWGLERGLAANFVATKAAAYVGVTIPSPAANSNVPSNAVNDNFNQPVLDSAGGYVLAN